MADFLLFSVLLVMAIAVFICVILSIIGIYFMISSCFMNYPPPVPSSGLLKEKALQDVCAYLQNKKGLTIMDLGSGWGTMLLPLAKRFPQHRFIGIEHAFFPYVVSKLRARKLPNLHFERGDIFKTDITGADVIYCFLMQKLMNDLTPYLKQNMHSGARLYSCRFYCPDWKPAATVSLGSKYDTYYLYIKD